MGRVFAPAGISATVLNIYRGILNILQMSIKKNQNLYELQEVLIAFAPQNSTQGGKKDYSLTAFDFFLFFFCLQNSLDVRVYARPSTSSMRTEKMGVSS